MSTVHSQKIKLYRQHELEVDQQCAHARKKHRNRSNFLVLLSALELSQNIVTNIAVKLNGSSVNNLASVSSSHAVRGGGSLVSLFQSVEYFLRVRLALIYRGTRNTYYTVTVTELNRAGGLVSLKTREVSQKRFVANNLVISLNYDKN